MLDSPMIDTSIGPMLFFASISLIVTSIQTLISSLFRLRGKNLQKGIHRLVGDEVVKDIYNHPLMETMKGKSFLGKNRLPSYLKSKYFSQILLDVISPGEKTLDKGIEGIKESIKKLPNSDLKNILQTFSKKANNKIENFETLIFEWFDAGMERASGRYQRYIQGCLFVISFILVGIINENALTVAKVLWENERIRNQVVRVAKERSLSKSEEGKNENMKKKQPSISDWVG